MTGHALVVTCKRPLAQPIAGCRNTVSLPAPLRAVYPLTTRTSLNLRTRASSPTLRAGTRTTQIALRGVLPRRVGTHPCSKSRTQRVPGKVLPAAVITEGSIWARGRKKSGGLQLPACLTAVSAGTGNGLDSAIGEKPTAQKLHNLDVVKGWR